MISVCLYLSDFTFLFFFFFKQKTAYEMRISDWSSDVCSSDLIVRPAQQARRRSANLHMIAPDGDEVVHRIEGRDLIGAHERHIELCRDIFDHRHGQPALRLRLGADLALREVEQRHHRGALTSRRIARDDRLRLLDRKTVVWGKS